MVGAAFYAFLPLGLEQHPLVGAGLESQGDPGSKHSCVGFSGCRWCLPTSALPCQAAPPGLAKPLPPFISSAIHLESIH